MIREYQPISEQLTVEINVISQCLQEEEGIWIPPRRGSSTNSIPAVVKLQHQDWIEPSVPRNSVFSDQFNATKVEESRLGFKPRRSDRDRFSVWLAPDCSTAMFLMPNAIALYSIGNIDSTNQISRLISHLPSPSSLQAAAISNHYVAALYAGTLTLYKYGRNSAHAVGSDRWGTGLENDWAPRCLGIHETDERVWVAVGGHTREVDGDIKMYRFERLSECLFRHVDTFRRPGADPFPTDYPRMLQFCPDGTRISCVTHRNRVLVWALSNNLRPVFPPFRIERTYRFVSLFSYKESICT